MVRRPGVQLIEQLAGKHIVLPVVGEPAEVQVGEVIVVPQPFGSLFARILNGQGQLVEAPLARGRVAVIDIGMQTTDYVLADQLQYIEPGSGSITTAMARVYELVGRAIQDEYDLSEAHQLEHERWLEHIARQAGFGVEAWESLAAPSLVTAMAGYDQGRTLFDVYQPNPLLDTCGTNSVFFVAPLDTC